MPITNPEQYIVVGQYFQYRNGSKIIPIVCITEVLNKSKVTFAFVVREPRSRGEALGGFVWTYLQTKKEIETGLLVPVGVDDEGVVDMGGGYTGSIRDYLRERGRGSR